MLALNRTSQAKLTSTPNMYLRDQGQDSQKNAGAGGSWGTRACQT